MANTSVGVNEVHQLAKAHLIAKSVFNQRYAHFWKHEVNPCSEETGWKLLDIFRREVERYRFKFMWAEGGVKAAAWEILRLQLVGQTDYNFEDVVGFVKWYEFLKGKISSAIDHLYEFQGDSFGDLVDAYPLAGRTLVERALATHPESDRPRREGYLNEQEVADAVLETLGPQWHKLICQSPNYVAIALGAACRQCFLHRIQAGEDEQVEWSEEEKSALTFATYYDE